MKRFFKNPFFWIPASILAVILLMSFWVHLATTQYWGFIDLTKMNEIGDALGGTTAPFIGLLVAILTFFAFMSQVNFNKSQIDFNKQQLKYVKDQIIENKITSLNHTFDILANTYHSRAPLTINPDNLDKLGESYKKSYNINEDEISEFLSKELKVLISSSEDQRDVRIAHNIIFTLVNLLMEFEMQELSDELYEQRRATIMHSYYIKCIFLLDPNFHDLFKIYIAICLKEFDLETAQIISPDYNDFKVIDDIKKTIKA